jgi:hypothetical protein
MVGTVKLFAKVSRLVYVAASADACVAEERKATAKEPFGQAASAQVKTFNRPGIGGPIASAHFLLLRNKTNAKKRGAGCDG